MEHLSHSEQETEQLGEQVARWLAGGGGLADTGGGGVGAAPARGGGRAGAGSARAAAAGDDSPGRRAFRRGAQHDGWRVITITGVDGL